MTSFTRLTAALLACPLLVVLMTACGSGSNPEPKEGTAASAAATTVTVAPSDSPLPEGTYRTPELTRKQLLAAGKKAGLKQAQAEQAMAEDGIKQIAAFALKLEAGQFIQFYSHDDGAEAIGSRGTYQVMDNDTIVTTEECCGKTTFGYRLEGDSIHISWIKDEHHADKQACQADAECWMGLIIFESAPFSRV